MNKKQWPSISITESDSDLALRIIQQNGLLKGIDQKDLLLIAAALAVENNAPKVTSNSNRRKDVTHRALINSDSYNEYRQYIAMIHFHASGNKNLQNMSDPKIMVDTFIDYAQRGLHLLKAGYLESNDSDERLLKNFAEILESIE